MKNKSQTLWAGKVHFEPGIGVFYGDSGDNEAHKHWAHQIVLGVDSLVKIRSGKDLIQSGALWIEAGSVHQLEEGRLLTIYIDPLHVLSKQLGLSKAKPEASISPVQEAHSNRWKDWLATEQLSDFIAQLKVHYGSTIVERDQKLERVLALIATTIESDEGASREHLAKLAGLSPSRFSHWFSEQTGIPMRSYKKWLRIVKGIELSTKMNLTDAALLAGFSDQAHFCRAVMDAFGVSPANVKSILSAQ